MIEQNKGLIMDADKAYLALLPGICIIVLVFAFMMLGNGLRDAFDVKDSSSEGVNV
jgi:peptide/nickel transport system permease protein